MAGARSEAEAAFGDGTVFVERLVTEPRHIEVQIMADRHGATRALFERECSIQRRHQKIVEEAPSPFVDAGLRRRLSEAAEAAARAVDYVGAGTVEFIAASDGTFWFLEMNTRLQVEHPVTEEITGLDLVRLQIEAAMGADLSGVLADVTMEGHAIEVRIYAEDPQAGFLPTAGRMDRFELEAPGVRVESGVESGDEISVHYDPMLAKVIAWAPGRDEAARRLGRALRRARIHGPVTNRDLLVRILEHPEFLAGQTDTGFLVRNPPGRLGRPLPGEDEERRSALAAALASQVRRRSGARVQSTIPSGWRNNPSQLQTMGFAGAGGDLEVGYRLEDGRFEVNGEPGGDGGGGMPGGPGGAGGGGDTGVVRGEPGGEHPLCGRTVGTVSSGGKRALSGGVRPRAVGVAAGAHAREGDRSGAAGGRRGGEGRGAGGHGGNEDGTRVASAPLGNGGVGAVGARRAGGRRTGSGGHGTERRFK